MGDFCEERKGRKCGRIDDFYTRFYYTYRIQEQSFVHYYLLLNDVG